MKKNIATISLMLLFCSLFSQTSTPTTLYGCFEYFDEVFTEEEKATIKNFDSPYLFCFQNFFIGRNDYLCQTSAYKEGKLNFVNDNKKLKTNLIPDGYPGIHFEDYPGMIFRSYYYLLKYGDCRWDFILKAYAPTTFTWKYEDTGVLATVYPDNISDSDLKYSRGYECNYFLEKVYDTVLFFKNNLNETYIYSFAYSWRKIPEEDFDYLLNNKTDSQMQAYFDELFKDSPFIGGL